MGRALAGVVMGLVAAALAVFVFLFAVGPVGSASNGTPFIAAGGFIGTLTLVLSAEKVRFAWGRGLLTAGLLCFIFPIAAAVLAGPVLFIAPSDVGDALAGVGGVLMVIFGIVGFVLGVIFVVAAFFCLRGKSSRLQ